MYEDFSEDYDRFVSWPGRLAFELPFIEHVVCPAPARVLDAACGTGMHALALAQKGYKAAGADLFPGMVAKARANCADAGLNVRFETAGFGGLAAAFAPDRFDALVCLGNSLPHVLTAAEVEAALADFTACLRPGGKLLIQNRNFNAVMAQSQRWMEPQAAAEGTREWLFLRFYDFLPDGLIDFHIITLRRNAPTAGWQQLVRTTRLRPILRDELVTALNRAGFANVQEYGGMDGSPFDPASSGNLVVTARLKT